MRKSSTRHSFPDKLLITGRNSGAVSNNNKSDAANEIRKDGSNNEQSGLTDKFKKLVDNSTQNKKNKRPRRKKTTDELVPLDEVTKNGAERHAKQNDNLTACPSGNATSKSVRGAKQDAQKAGNNDNVNDDHRDKQNTDFSNATHNAQQNDHHEAHHSGRIRVDNLSEYSASNTSKYNVSNKHKHGARKQFKPGSDTNNASRFSRSSYISALEKSAPRKLDSKAKKKIILGIAAGATIIAALAGTCYVANANSYDNTFLPNTRINGTNVAGLTVNEAFDKAGDSLHQATTNIIDKDQKISITGSDIDMKLNENDIQELKDSQNKWDWVSAMFGNGTDITVGTTYDSSKLENAIESLDCVSGKDRTDPVDSKVTFDKQSENFIATESKEGDRTDKGKILDAATRCVENGGGDVNASDFFESPKYTKDSPEISSAVNTANSYINKTIYFNIDGIDNAEKLTKTELCGIVSVDNNMNVDIDESAITTWLKEIGKKYDTAGTERSYTTAWGKATTIPAGESTFGWTTDESSMLPIIVDDIKSDKSEINQDFAYTQKADGPKGGAEWGSFYVDIDKIDQEVRVVKDGSVIFEAETVTGTNTPEKDTPCGIWTVLDKQTNYTMVGETDPKTGQPEYKTPCDYWIRFTWSGCGFHDAEWRGRWSANEWKNGNGSHGCANMHLSDVKQLYSLVSVGTPVIIHN